MVARWVIPSPIDLYAGSLAVTMSADASVTDLVVVAQGMSRSFTPSAALTTEPDRDQ